MQSHMFHQNTMSFRPISSAGSKGSFTFDIPVDPDKFTDAETLKLHGCMHMLKKAGTNIAAKELLTIFLIVYGHPLVLD